MGLDTSHDCFHGAYSAFTRWRNAIAEAAGFYVWPVIHDDKQVRDTIMLEWHWATPERLMGNWDAVPPSPLYYLFLHSDCEGEIHPEQAAPLADELEKLLPELAKMEDVGGHISARGGLVGVTEKFISGLREAFKNGEPVGFH